MEPRRGCGLPSMATSGWGWGDSSCMAVWHCRSHRTYLFCWWAAAPLPAAPADLFPPFKTWRAAEPACTPRYLPALHMGRASPHLPRAGFWVLVQCRAHQAWQQTSCWCGRARKGLSTEPLLQGVWRSTQSIRTRYLAAGACLSALWALCWLPCTSWRRHSACGKAQAASGAPRGPAGPGIPSLAPPWIAAFPLLPRGPCCHHWVTCQGAWPGACSKGTRLEKTSLLQQGSCFAAKKRKLFNFSGQKGAENWDEKKDKKEIMQIKAHSDISQLYSEKAWRAFRNKQSHIPASKSRMTQKLHLRKKHLSNEKLNSVKEDP